MGRNRKWVLEDSIQDAVWEDHLARASSTLGPLGKAAQSVSRCQSQEGFEVEGFSHDASAKSQCAESCAHPATTISSSESSRGACGSSRQDPKVAGCTQRVGRCQHGRERESGEVFATCTSSSRGASRLRTDHLHAEICRAGKEETGFRRGRQFPLLSRAGTRVWKHWSNGHANGHARGSVQRRPCAGLELSAWVEDRQKDVQEALRTGDHSRVVELSPMLTNGAERTVEMTRQEISNEFRSRTAPGEGRFGTSLGERTFRCTARYGHRGTRVGGLTRRLRRVCG